MSRLSAPTNALVQLLKAALGLTGLAPAQLQQTEQSSGAPETLRAAERIVWELLPPANAPPGANTGIQPCALVLMYIRPAPSPCAGICKARALAHRASAHTKAAFMALQSTDPSNALRHQERRSSVGLHNQPQPARGTVDIRPSSACCRAAFPDQSTAFLIKTM